MVPEYVQKLLTLLGETEYTTNLVVAGPEDDVETGTVYEIVHEIYIIQVLIWDKGVHEFTFGTFQEMLLHQCDLGLEKDYQAFEDFVKEVL